MRSFPKVVDGECRPMNGSPCHFVLNPADQHQPDQHVRLVQALTAQPEEHGTALNPSKMVFASRKRSSEDTSWTEKVFVQTLSWHGRFGITQSLWTWRTWDHSLVGVSKWEIFQIKSSRNSWWESGRHFLTRRSRECGKSCSWCQIWRSVNQPTGQHYTSTR